MNIVLCGMMGVGKTTVGLQLAQMTNRKFYDTDSVIVQRFGDISRVFKEYGEIYFRGLETKVICELATMQDLVISTGGGAVLKEENVEALKKQGKIVFLRANLQTLEKRLAADTTRPLLQTEESLKQRLQKLLETRSPIYQKVADFVVDVDGKTPDNIAQEIISLMQKSEKTVGQV